MNHWSPFLRRKQESLVAISAQGSDEFPAVLKDPRILTRFVCHTFADLKKYHYYYWFVFPAFILPPTIQMSQPVQPIYDFLKSEEIIQKSKA